MSQQTGLISRLAHAIFIKTGPTKTEDGRSRDHTTFVKVHERSERRPSTRPGRLVLVAWANAGH